MNLVEKINGNYEKDVRKGEPIQREERTGGLPTSDPSISVENGETLQKEGPTGTFPRNYPFTRAENVETPQHGDAGDRGAITTLPESYPSLVEKYTSCRWRLGYLIFAAFTLVQTLLNSMSFALVCMTTAPVGTYNQSLKEVNSSALSENTTSGYWDMNPSEAEFDYSSETQGLLISAVYYPGIISPLLGSFASRVVGPKKVIMVCMSCGGVMMMLIPTAARTHVYVAVLCRVVLGFAMTTVSSVTMDLWVYWGPEREKGQLVAYSFNGYNAANIVTFSLSGLLCLVPLDRGWPFIFYVFGGLTLLWCCLWQWMVYASPEVHPTISEKEKNFILLNRSKLDPNAKKRKIPWMAMIKTRGVWAYCIICFAHNYNSALMFSYIPAYMATALNFNIEETGFLSSLPYVIRVMSIPVTSYISLRLLSCLSVTKTRKLIQCGGFVIAAVATSVLSVFREGQSYEAVAVLSLSNPFQAATVSSGTITPLDLAPQYAAILTSVGTGLSQAGNMISPLVASYILTERTREQWNMVFFMMSGVYVVGAFLFLILGSGERQPWAGDASINLDIPEHRKTSKTSHVNEAYVADKDETTQL